MFREEKTLIKGLKEGNENAYKHLYTTYYKDLTIYCLNLTNNLPQAEDIVQNTLIKVWTNRDRITIKTALKSYLYRAVFNGFATEYGKKQRKDKFIIQAKIDTLNNIVEQNTDFTKEKIKKLEKAIDQLPKKCKTVFLMNKIQGYRYKEIATQLNISEKTVEKHISRAIVRIKKMVFTNKNILLVIYSKVFNSTTK